MAVENNGITISMVGLITVISLAFTLGGSATGAWLSIQNGERAINVAVQHGGELDKIRARLGQLETDLIRRTAERWTRSDQIRYEASHEKESLSVQRRIGALERIVDKEFP